MNKMKKYQGCVIEPFRVIVKNVENTIKITATMNHAILKKCSI